METVLPKGRHKKVVCNECGEPFALYFDHKYWCANGIDKSIDRGIDSTCECLQIFTRSPRSWAISNSSIPDEKIKLFLEKSEKANYFDTAIHMPYLPNLASPEEELFQKSIQVLSQEIKKSYLLKTPFIISHLGSPKDQNRNLISASAKEKEIAVLKTRSKNPKRNQAGKSSNPSLISTPLKPLPRP